MSLTSSSRLAWASDLRYPLSINQERISESDQEPQTVSRALWKLSLWVGEVGAYADVGRGNAYDVSLINFSRLTWASGLMTLCSTSQDLSSESAHVL